MIYYMIRHKKTGEYMPQLKRGTGYSHWNPAKVQTAEHFKKKILGVPRLFPSLRIARQCIVAWNAMPNARYEGYTSFGEDDYNVNFKPDGRTKEDLEIVEVNIEERSVIGAVA